MVAASLAAVCALAAAPGSALAFGPIAGFGFFGSGAGEVGIGGDLDLAADGSVYVPDFFNNRVDVFTAQGEFRFAFGNEVSPAKSNVCTAASGCVAGTATDEWSGIVHPEHLAVGPEGNVYIAGLNRVDVFSAQGSFREAFGKEVNPDVGDVCGRTGCQAGIADETAGSISPSGLALDSSGRVYIAGANNRIDVFSREGEFLFAFGDSITAGLGEICTVATECRKGATGPQAGAVSGIDVEVTPGGDIAILNVAFHRVDVFSRQGLFLFAFGKGVNPGGGNTCTFLTACVAGAGGTGAGEIGLGAKSIAVTPSGSFVIANGDPVERIDEFGPDGNFIRGFGGGVIDGEEEFQVCTSASGCQAGFRSFLPGATGSPQGATVDGGGTIYVAEEAPVRIEVIDGSPDPPRRQPLPPPPPPQQVVVSNRFKLGKLTLNKRKGTAVLTVTVPGPGDVALGGRGIRLTVTAARAAGDVKLPVRLSGVSASRLAKTGSVRVRVLVLFEPNGGKARIQGMPAVLKKLLRR